MFLKGSSSKVKTKGPLPERKTDQWSGTICEILVEGMHHEEQFCEIILNLGQWFRICCLKDFLSGALAVLFGGAEPFMQF